MTKKPLRLGHLEATTLQHTINIVLDIDKNRRQLCKDEILRLIVIRTQLEDIKEQQRAESCTN